MVAVPNGSSQRREVARRALATAARSPLAWILAATFALRLVGIGWGLPASDGWDVDGIAPRDFLAGLVETLTPGHYFQYPPAHLALLAALTSPVTVVMLAKARSLAPPDVVAEALKVPYMTIDAVVARFVSVVMSVGVVWSSAKIAEEARGERAGLFAAGACAVNVVLTYYGHTTNLDVPCLFWGMLAILWLTRAIARSEPRRLRRFAVFAALAIATKDQGYALFALSVPAALLLWLGRERGTPRARAIVREIAIGAAIGVALLLVLDGVVFNPSGFRARVAFLTGPASQPYAYYSADLTGRLDALEDSFARFPEFYPIVLAPLVAYGVVLAAAGRARERRLPALVPLLAAISFTLVFNCVARRTEHRFTMPAMVLWSIYAGIGGAALFEAASSRGRRGRLVAQIAASFVFAWGAFRAAAVDANILLDPRYDAEAWLGAHVAPGDVVEVYGETVYLPRLPVTTARVVHVDPRPVGGRNPIAGAEELQAPLGDIGARAPRFVVVPIASAAPYLDVVSGSAAEHGRIRSGKQRESNASPESAFYRALFEGRSGYRVAHVATFTSALWPRLDIHASLSRDVFVFERVP